MIFNSRPVETGGEGAGGAAAPPSQILTKVDLLPIDNNSEN